MATEPAMRITAEDLLAMPGGKRREIVEGELRETNPAGADHGTIALAIGAALHGYAVEHGGRTFAAETGFILASEPLTVRAPDAAYVTAERASAVGSRPGYWDGAPDLAAEVVSPGDTYNETHEKALAWLAHGAQVVLVADPASRHVTRYRSPADITVFAAGEPVDCAPAMPGFTPTAAELIPAL